MIDPATAVVIHGAGDLRIEERAPILPRAGEALIDVELGGICGSDISYYRNGAVGAFKVTAPMVLGHEVIGRVREVGADVTGFDDGARVAVDPSSPCGRCDRCREGRWNICLQPHFLGSASTQPHTDGGFVSALTSRAPNLVPLADDLDDELAVFAEPLAVTVHALRRATPNGSSIRGARVLVVGAGPIGGMLVALASREGAEVTAADVQPSRLGTAVALGASEVVHVGVDDPGLGYDLVFDASGAAGAIADGLTRVRRGGRFVLVGLPHGGPVEMPLGISITGEIDIVGSFRFNHHEFEQSVAHLADGLDLRPLISSCHGVHDADAAFVEACSGHAMKVQLDFREASRASSASSQETSP